MNRLDHLMAATDLSPGSVNAIARGYLIAGQTGVRYTIMHAFDQDKLKPWRGLLGKKTAAVSKKLLGDASRQLNALCADPVLNRGITAKLQVEQGKAPESIIRHSRKQGADLVLVGAHGMNSFRDVLVGSTASRLVRKSTIPVIVVRKPPRSEYRRVLVAIDFSPASESLIRTARLVAPQATLVLLHTYEVPFESKMQFAGVGASIISQYRAEALVKATRRLNALARKSDLGEKDYTLMVEHGDAAHYILHYQRHHRCDLVAIGKHGTNVVDELLLGSVTDTVLTKTAADVLVVTDRHRPAHAS